MEQLIGQQHQQGGHCLEQDVVGDVPETAGRGKKKHTEEAMSLKSQQDVKHRGERRAHVPLKRSLGATARVISYESITVTAAPDRWSGEGRQLLGKSGNRGANARSPAEFIRIPRAEQNSDAESLKPGSLLYW